MQSNIEVLKNQLRATPSKVDFIFRDGFSWDALFKNASEIGINLSMQDLELYFANMYENNEDELSLSIDGERGDQVLVSFGRNDSIRTEKVNKGSEVAISEFKDSEISRAGVAVYTGIGVGAVLQGMGTPLGVAQQRETLSKYLSKTRLSS